MFNRQHSTLRGPNYPAFTYAANETGMSQKTWNCNILLCIYTHLYVYTCMCYGFVLPHSASYMEPQMQLRIHSPHAVCYRKQYVCMKQSRGTCVSVGITAANIVGNFCRQAVNQRILSSCVSRNVFKVFFLLYAAELRNYLF